MRGAKQKRRSHGFTIGAFAVGGGATKGRILQEYSPVRERTTCPFSPRKLQLRHSPGGRSNKERSSKCIPPHQSKHNLHIRREGGATRRGAPSVFPLSQNTTCTFTGRVQLRRVKKQAGQCPAQITIGTFERRAELQESSKITTPLRQNVSCKFPGRVLSWFNNTQDTM